MTTEQRCLRLLKEMSAYRKSKDELMAHNVSERLNLSFSNYEKDLDGSLGYLTRRNELRVLKKINKL